MGWTEYIAKKFNNCGSVNRKAECDSYFLEGLNRGFFKVEASSMNGSVYYAAVTPLKRCKGENANDIEDIPASERKTYAVVMLTIVRKDRGVSWFGYKPMDESMIPFCYDCPKRILNLLSPTDDENSIEWRKRCEENSKKVKLSSLPIGTKIKWNGRILTKYPASYQFKTPFWVDEEKMVYISKKRITSFEVVE